MAIRDVTEGSEPVAPGDRPSLLLVEDDAKLSGLLSRLFSGEGYDVTLARDGHTGLHLALINEYSAMIIDRGLPAIEGVDLVRRLRSRGVATPVLVLTARGTTEDRVEGLDAGAEDYVVKPFEIDELLARLRALRRRHADHSDRLRRQPARDEYQQQEIERLVDDTRVLTDIVNDLLLSAQMQHRPDAGQPVDLGLVAADVKSSFTGTADAAGVDLVVDADPGTTYVVTGVPSALRRAVAALVDNSLSHVERGHRITITLASASTAIRVIVSDNGEGLDPELASKLTQRFHRGSGNRAAERGGQSIGHRLGLGLALVAEVVQAHRGTMDIDGAPGRGAVVTLTFPPNRAPDPAPPVSRHRVWRRRG